MTSAEHVADSGLAGAAIRLAAAHQQHPDDPLSCAAGNCHGPWPCLASRLAAHAGTAARGTWAQAWTARQDLITAGVTVAG